MEYLKDNCPDKYAHCDFKVTVGNAPWGVVRTKGGWYLVCLEGVMYKLDDLDDGGAVFNLHTQSDNGFSLFPVLDVSMQPEQILDLPVSRYVPIRNFVRKFGTRLEANYPICIKELNAAKVLPPRPRC